MSLPSQVSLLLTGESLNPTVFSPTKLRQAVVNVLGVVVAQDVISITASIAATRRMRSLALSSINVDFGITADTAMVLQSLHRLYCP